MLRPSIVRGEEEPRIDCDSARVVRKKGSCVVATRRGESEAGAFRDVYILLLWPTSFYHRIGIKLKTYGACSIGSEQAHAQPNLKHLCFDIAVIACKQSKVEMIWLARSGQSL